MPVPLPRTVDRAPDSPTWLRTEATIAGRLLVVGVATLAAGWVLLQLGVVAVAGFLAFALTAMLWPVVARLRRWMPGVLAALLAVLAVVALLVGLLWFVVSQVIAAMPQLEGSVMDGLSSLDAWAASRNITPSGELMDQAVTMAQRRAGEIFTGVRAVARSSARFLQATGTLLLVTVFGTVFALAGGRELPRTVLGWAPAARRRELDGAVRSSFTTARWWMWASTVTGLVDGVFIALGLALLGVPLAIPIGALTFVLGFIPLIGATVAGAVAVVVALVFGGVTTALFALVVVILVQQVEGNVLSPLLLSRAMSFPPVVTLFLSMAGGAALGMAGIFLAVPVAGVVVAFRKGWVEARQDDADETSSREGKRPSDDASDEAAQDDSSDEARDQAGQEGSGDDSSDEVSDPPADARGR
ncbi:AI-2E family transporter [Arsenicicoccus sp. oral taxon 190]|uniref:AI-2E family transporter n=1 Tax=Arsenicicoccus sp. oral taxon 190 TaxID=1658671 RepID=UPI00067A3958|nr:AI-2E family transporter [Arsenicicoccus sp. oral taxon 190]AKT50402.1 hypothetical protein ADJ73_02025 [Arsenicicoccus sp. oral taxon 190]